MNKCWNGEGAELYSLFLFYNAGLIVARHHYVREYFLAPFAHNVFFTFPRILLPCLTQISSKSILNAECFNFK